MQGGGQAVHLHHACVNSGCSAAHLRLLSNATLGISAKQLVFTMPVLVDFMGWVELHLSAASSMRWKRMVESGWVE